MQSFSSVPPSSAAPCCASITTASKPLLLNVSATSGQPDMTQPKLRTAFVVANTEFHRLCIAPPRMPRDAWRGRRGWCGARRSGRDGDEGGKRERKEKEVDCQEGAGLYLQYQSTCFWYQPGPTAADR